MKCNKILLAALAAASFCLVAIAAQGQDIESSFFGMGVSQSSDLPKVVYGTLSHPPLAWTSIEGAARGTYDFSSIDKFVTAAPKDANGVAQIDIPLGWTPGWAVSSKSSCTKETGGVIGCTVPPDDLKDLTDFVTALIEHYNGSTAPHVKYYEIWNEANTQAFWTGTIPQLVAMGQAVYPILKQDRNSSVMAPSVVWAGGQAFVTSYLTGGGAKYADGVSFHAYPSKTGVKIVGPVPLPETAASTNAPIQTMVAAFRQVSDLNGLVGKPMISSEGGWGVNGVTDPDMQSAWITQFEIVMAGLYAPNNLRFVTWYTWGHALSGTIESSTGQPTAAAEAYQEVNGWLVGQRILPCTNAGNIWSCKETKDLIVWDVSQTCSKGVCTTAPYTPPKGYEKYVDVTGATSTISGSIPLGVKPLLLEP
jgi:hypothetical protein